MLISPNNCQFGSKFWIRFDETDAFLINTRHKCSLRTRMEPWTSEPLNPWTPTNISISILGNLIDPFCSLFKVPCSRLVLWRVHGFEFLVLRTFKRKSRVTAQYIWEDQKDYISQSTQRPQRFKKIIKYFFSAFPVIPAREIPSVLVRCPISSPHNYGNPTFPYKDHWQNNLGQNN